MISLIIVCSRREMAEQYLGLFLTQWLDAPFVIVGWPPFVKSISRNEAAPFSKRFAKGWFFGNRFGPRIYHAVSAVRPFGPVRNQPPTQHHQFPLPTIILANGANILRRGNFITGGQIGKCRQIEMFCQFLGFCRKAKASAHGSMIVRTETSSKWIVYAHGTPIPGWGATGGLNVCLLSKTGLHSSVVIMSANSHKRTYAGHCLSRRASGLISP